MTIHGIEIFSLSSAVVVFIMRFAVLPLLARIIGEWLMKRLVKSEAELITWLHFKKRAQGDRHKASNVVTCGDDGCVKIGPRQPLS